MKKKCVVLLLTTALCMAVLSGCGQIKETEKTTTKDTITIGEEEAVDESADESAAVTEEEKTETQDDTEAAEKTAQEQAAELQEAEVESAQKKAAEAAGEFPMDEKQQSALYVMDSLLMCMMENDSTYEPQNPEFFWSALFYEIGNYGYLREGTSTIESDGVEGVAKVYYRTAQEYASALFADYSDLLPLPDGMTSVQMNPQDNEQYLFQMGDRGISAARITAWTDNGDGTYQATAELYGTDDNSVLATGEFTLVDSPYVDAVSEPIFYYTVSDAKLLAE